MEPDYSFLSHLSRGDFFPKTESLDTPFLSYNQLKDQLPLPFVAHKPLWEACYAYATGLAFENRKVPSPESGFVSCFVDAAFNEDIFLWDTAFITMFCNLFHPYIPGIRSLDNFYCKQLPDGEIPREIVRETGKDMLLWVNAYQSPLYSYFHNSYGHRRLKEMTNLPYEGMYRPDLGREIENKPYLTLDNLNHPIAAWAEWMSYLHTGDIQRLTVVYPPLYAYYQAMQYHLQHENGLYVTDWASMDNSPRNGYLGCGVDISCEMVLFARNLMDILRELEKHNLAPEQCNETIAKLTQDAQILSDTINKLMWDPKTQFYYDYCFDGTQAPVKTIAAYWALVAGVADAQQAKALAAWLEDPNTFARMHRVPVCAADEEGYDPQGGYWRGSVWAPTNTMVVYGLEQYGYHQLARDIALNHLEAVCQVFHQTGTIWENYPADSISSGNADKKDFVGWSGLGPILYLIRYGIGLDANATTGTVTWSIDKNALPLGCKRYWFFGKQADFFARPSDSGVYIQIKTQDSFTLSLQVEGRVLTKEIQGDTAFDL